MVKLVKGQNDLLSQYPACINEWDFNKNHPLSPDAVVAGSSKKVWWICCKGHSYEQSINLHVGRGYGCPYCSHRKVLTGYNDLETLFPDIATEKAHARAEGRAEGERRKEAEILANLKAMGLSEEQIKQALGK